MGLSWLPSLRPSLRLRLMPTTDTTAILMPMEDTEPMAMATHTLITDFTTERGPRMLMPTMDIPMPMDMEDTDLMAMVPTLTLITDTLTTERGPLMLSPRPRLTQL